MRGVWAEHCRSTCTVSYCFVSLNLKPKPIPAAHRLIRSVPNSRPFEQGNSQLVRRLFRREFCEAGSLDHTSNRKSGNLGILLVNRIQCSSAGAGRFCLCGNLAIIQK